ncbi:hypothetical protein [Salinigranum marinum]|uniref:hypothetical protein n=1 Tax=Salinigranum marinum TaxID=1515595 RepID=UPI002989DE77|nr:hypothetical protein [Salinigranum marinum]
MDALVHFAVGLTGGLLALLLVDWHPRREFLAMFASGVWALVPDAHWMVRAVGFDGVADVWFAFHRSRLANLCWFHGALDRRETGLPRVEMGVSLAVLLVVVGVYAAVNDWGGN